MLWSLRIPGKSTVNFQEKNVIRGLLIQEPLDRLGSKELTQRSSSTHSSGSEMCYDAVQCHRSFPSMRY